MAEGGVVATLVQAIRDHERRHRTIRAELADLDRPRLAMPGAIQLRALLRMKAEEWQALLRKHAPIARQMVRKLVEGIVFTPDRETQRYTFLATGTVANFFSGMVCPQAMASLTPTCWNQIAAWLQKIDGLRSAAWSRSSTVALVGAQF